MAKVTPVCACCYLDLHGDEETPWLRGHEPEWLRRLIDARADLTRERDMLSEVVTETARELGCEPDNEAMLERARDIVGQLAECNRRAEVRREFAAGMAEYNANGDEDK